MDELIAGCFALQKLYGKAPESMETVVLLFHTILSKHSAEKVIKAFQTWLERSQEFPTPADIIGLIKRNGKPPLSESQFIAISRKEYGERTTEEHWFLRQWQEQQSEQWQTDTDPQKQADILADNMRMREERKILKSEIQRLNQLLISAKGASEKPALPVQDKIQRTVEHMKATGCPDSDIQDFILTAA